MLFISATKNASEEDDCQIEHTLTADERTGEIIYIETVIFTEGWGHRHTYTLAAQDVDPSRIYFEPALGGIAYLKVVCPFYEAAVKHDFEGLGSKADGKGASAQPPECVLSIGYPSKKLKKKAIIASLREFLLRHGASVPVVDPVVVAPFLPPLLIALASAGKAQFEQATRSSWIEPAAMTLHVEISLPRENPDRSTFELLSLDPGKVSCWLNNGFPIVSLYSAHHLETCRRQYSFGGWHNSNGIDVLFASTEDSERFASECRSVLPQIRAALYAHHRKSAH